ncbi:MAG TPA: NAD(P)/FAD-dependent oxidoreductase [Caldithrix abyssi]|uniref:NAD(P)/FAD-dependent oxidoreductase n=1 Tax=Caldithrix abyssi TaxID=187145 RepID=A0A7V1LLX0_CALAY|nr:NAD(P)/FAD-dependent oxidoreductase [Caldithrix abyssi]
MAKLVILGAGIAGHTAALHARRKLGREHEIIVIAPNSKWNWIPSNIWVGVGWMKPEQVTFELAPVYKKQHITFKQARAVSIHPQGDSSHAQPFVSIEYTLPGKAGQTEQVAYDYLINATGPKLNFAATEGLGPEKNSLSVCTYGHAEQTAGILKEHIERMKKGEHLKFVVGTGHGMCTCQGAAFEYIFNLEFELQKAGVRDKATITWLSNEVELGDFGIGGMLLKRGGYITHSRIFAESLFTERGLDWITQAHVTKVEKNRTHYELLNGETGTIEHDFAMLLPPFSGVGLKAFDKEGTDITSDLFAANGFMKVDADYTPKPYDQWKPSDWPKTYQNPLYKNIFAVGIAFAPPHGISKPMKNPNGTPINPTPPRTGMPSGVMGRIVAYSIVDLIKGRNKPLREASMANMGAACIASAGAGLFNGSGVSMTMYPIIPDFDKYPETGRDIKYTTGEIGLAGHWIKHALHYAFIYKAKALPLWMAVPE